MFVELLTNRVRGEFRIRRKMDEISFKDKSQLYWKY
jgi:hypothetical protein